jgi:repressor LexA
LEVIERYYDTTGYSPTIREIADMAGIKSTSTVHRHFEVLNDRLMVYKRPIPSETAQGRDRRNDILKAINKYYENYGFSPTVREIAEMTGLKSTATVHRHLESLKEQGRISWNPTMPRAIKVL